MGDFEESKCSETMAVWTSAVKETPFTDQNHVIWSTALGLRLIGPWGWIFCLLYVVSKSEQHILE